MSEVTENAEVQATDTAPQSIDAEVQATDTAPQSINDLQPKMQLTGTVTRLELYGAFIDLGIGVNALIHISKLGKDRVNRVADVLSKGDEVAVWVEKVDSEKGQVMVTMVEPLAVDWKDLEEKQVHTGTVTRLENFGAFINIGAEREGLVHISELSHGYVKHPSEVLTVGDEVQAQVLGFSKRKRRIDLSIKAILEKPESEGANVAEIEAYDQEEEEDEFQTAMEIALRQALGTNAPARSKKKKKKDRKKGRRQRIRSQQDDLLDRTLHH